MAIIGRNIQGFSYLGSNVGYLIQIEKRVLAPMRTTLEVLGLVALLMCSTVWGGFYFGRRFERQQVKRYLPTVMDRMCVQCNEIGEKDGYKKGLRTCDDVLDSINGGGRR